MFNWKGSGVVACFFYISRGHAGSIRHFSTVCQQDFRKGDIRARKAEKFGA